MKELYQKNKAVLKFLLFFFGTYLVLSFLYNVYLNNASSDKYYPDFVTHLVAQQVTYIANSLGYIARVYPMDTEPAMLLYINSKPIAKVVEGCNALSVLILFISFVMAFHQGLKRTALFIFAGTVLLYCTNVIRIVIISVAIYNYPEYTKFLHDIVFPALIYGMVFLLWVLWIRNYSVNKVENEKAA